MRTEEEVVADGIHFIQVALKDNKDRWNLLKEEKELTFKVDNGNEFPEVIHRPQEVHEYLQRIGIEATESMK